MSCRFGWTDTSIRGFVLLPGSEVGGITIENFALHLGSQDTEAIIIEGSLGQLENYLRDLLDQVTTVGRQ